MKSCKEMPATASNGRNVDSDRGTSNSSDGSNFANQEVLKLVSFFSVEKQKKN
jgi:hypothetical protein